MKHFPASRWFAYLLAVVAGLLLAASFPKIGIAGFAWIAPGLLVTASLNRGGNASFRIGFVGGIVSALVQFYWLLLIPVHGYPILGWLAMAAYLALFPAAWLWLVAPRFSLAATWFDRTFFALFGAAAWVALEMVRARLFGGLPWNVLGVSQYKMVPLIQLAAITGVYGVSFLVVWGSLSLLNGASQLLSHPSWRFIWQAEIILPMAAVITAFVFGAGAIHRADQISAKRPLPVAHVTFIQPSVPQTMIWDETENHQRFNELLTLTQRALDANPGTPADLLLWPEAALPSVSQADLARLSDIVREHHVWMLLGMDDVVVPPGSTNASEIEYFNAAALLNPRGELVKIYHKRKLVMFGEFVPATKWLPFLAKLTPITGGFSTGDRPVFFSILAGGHGVKFSSLICFEDIFPHLTREYVDDDTDFIINLTNNGWFGEGAAQWQHAVAAIFRAIENRRPLLRCTNNGLTCWVDEYGRIRQLFSDATGTVYGMGVMRADIPLQAPVHELTLYQRYGDWFGWVCVAVSLLAVPARIRRAIRQKRGEA